MTSQSPATGITHRHISGPDRRTAMHERGRLTKATAIAIADSLVQTGDSIAA